MKRPLLELSQRYQSALQRHLKQASKAGVKSAFRLGEHAVMLGLETLDIARIHKASLAALLVPGDSAAIRAQKVKRAESFFTESITPIEKTHRCGIQSGVLMDAQNEVLVQRTAQLATANRSLQKGVTQRKSAEKALWTSEQHHTKLLRESNNLNKHLRRLTHQIISAQENERWRISHELHDEIAQTLLGINVRLLTLKKGATARNNGFAKEIASAQRLVKDSVKMVNALARKYGA